jgi:hypothetical protein
LRKVPAQQVKPEGLTHQKRHPDQWCQRSLGQRKRILPGARRIKCRSLPMLKNVILRAWYCMLCQQLLLPVLPHQLAITTIVLDRKWHLACHMHSDQSTGNAASGYCTKMSQA